MKEITPEEIVWVKNKLKDYSIEYSEIYNELYDHILSSIENRRVNGDRRDIEAIFYSILYDELSGRAGIEEMQNSRIKAVQSLLSKALKEKFIHYFTSLELLKTGIVFLAFLLLFSYLNISPLNVFIIYIIIATIPFICLYFYDKKAIFPWSRKKPSLVRSRMSQIAGINWGLVNVIFYLFPILISFIIDIDITENQLNGVLTITLDYIGIFGVSTFLTVLMMLTLAITETIKIDYYRLIKGV